MRRLLTLTLCGLLLASTAWAQGGSFSRQIVPDFFQLVTRNTTAPAATACDAVSETGRVYWDSTNDVFYVCSGVSGWVTVSGSPMVYPGAGLPVSTGSAWGTSLSSTAPIFGASMTAGTIASQSVIKIQGTTDATPFTYTIAAPDLSADHALTLANGDTTLVTGTMAPTSGTLAQFAATTSAELAGVISDETGTGVLAFATAPTFTTSIGVGTGAAAHPQAASIVGSLGVYNTYTATDYEGATLVSTTGAVTLSAVTLGTGADNRDVVLTPAGTGGVNLGSKAGVGGLPQASELFTVYQNANSIGRASIINAASDTAAAAQLIVASAANLVGAVTVTATSAGYTTAGIVVADTGIVYSTKTGGLNVGTSGATQASLWTNGVKRMSFASDGTTIVNQAATFGLIATQDVLKLLPVTSATRFTGSITPTDLTADRTWTLPDTAGTVALSSYGGLYETGGSTAITITTAGTYYQWPTTTAGAASADVTVSAATDDITTTVAGTYRVEASVSFTATANATVTMQAAKEGTGLTNCMGQRKISAGGDVGSMSISCLVVAAANDSFTLTFTSSGNGDTVTPVYANLNIARVGG